MQVSWCEWTAEAFERADRERKPVLLSLLTAWSEACTAMDRTTYTNLSVVRLIEAEFVAVRVDADRRPDLNERYNLGGWPTTAFLTSQGDILSGGTSMDADEMADVLRKVSEASRARAAELVERAREMKRQSLEADRLAPVADDELPSIVARFGCLLLERFDRCHGGFGAAPKFPHARALLAALALERGGNAPDLSLVIDESLDQLSSLWNPVGGGFCRYAWGDDWSGLCSERTLEDNAALLELHIEAALTGRTVCIDRVAAIVDWVRRAMSDSEGSGYYNARGAAIADPTIYVDRNAMVVAAMLRAADLLDDPQLRNAALESFESVVVPTYVPGDGVAHVASGPAGAAVRGLLADQVHAAAALIWAHAATGRLPYSMLAAELMEYAVRQMWSERDGAFRDRADEHDPRMPFELNCLGACVLDRLAVLTGTPAYHDRARAILRALGGHCAALDLHAAAYVSAVREVIDRQAPAGLALSAVDWGLGS